MEIVILENVSCEVIRTVRENPTVPRGATPLITVTAESNHGGLQSECNYHASGVPFPIELCQTIPPIPHPIPWSVQTPHARSLYSHTRSPHGYISPFGLTNTRR